MKDQVKIANQSNSTIQLGPTVIDFSALNFGNKLAQANGQVNQIIKVLFALQIIDIVSSGLCMLLSPLYLVVKQLRIPLMQIAERWLCCGLVKYSWS
jgi:hypothetical protein